MEALARGRLIVHLAKQGLRLALGLFVLAGWSGLMAQVSREYDIKAVFLFNFAQFTDWPAGSFPETQSPLIIGILGTDPFGSTLGDIVRDESVRDRPVIVQPFTRVEDVRTCHILFISQSESRRLRSTLNLLKARAVLTVSDVDDFAAMGGMIEFYTENAKVRLRINNEAARAAGLVISSKLLRVSTIVTTTRN